MTEKNSKNGQSLQPEKVSSSIKVLKIKRDPTPESPRDWDNIGTMSCVHSRYRLGDEQEYMLPDSEKHFYLPLYLYDHSGITMNTTGFSCNWDSGQVGWIWVDKEKAKKELGEEDLEAKAKRIMKSEVEVYDKFLRGEVYGYFLVERKTCACCNAESEDDLDSCWGFFGDDHEKSGLFDSAGFKEGEMLIEGEI